MMSTFIVSTLVLLVGTALSACRTTPAAAPTPTASSTIAEETWTPGDVVAWTEPEVAGRRFGRRRERRSLRLTARRPSRLETSSYAIGGLAPDEYDEPMEPVREDVPELDVAELEIAETDSKQDLAKASQNPLADLISMPFQSNLNFGAGPFDRTTNVLNIQPVVPIKLSSQWNLVTRTIIPVIRQGHVESPDGSTFGLGDINPTAWLTPGKPGKIIWGVGGTIELPTATEDRIGAGKWSAGPSIVVLAMPGKWVLGGLAAQTWSFAGDDSRADVSRFFSQLFVNYNLSCGWFLTSAPIILANWKATGEKWTVPVGAGFGRVMKFGKQPVNWSVHAYYNVVRPDLAPVWQLRLQLAFLFPK